jgi:hypothetical protein
MIKLINNDRLGGIESVYKQCNDVLGLELCKQIREFQGQIAFWKEKVSIQEARIRDLESELKVERKNFNE